tara:strand:+ start:10157 stop:10360 length:204 start_codon:yes stop_codon:yes gene_type:complete
MKILEKLKLLKEKIETIEKINEDLIEINLANKTKIQSLEKKIKTLQKGIKDTTNDIEDFIKDLNANN